MEGGAARKAFDLALGDLGPYSLAFTRSGRFAALAGRRGHLALLDWLRLSTVCELQVQPCCIPTAQCSPAYALCWGAACEQPLPE